MQSDAKQRGPIYGGDVTEDSKETFIFERAASSIICFKEQDPSMPALGVSPALSLRTNFKFVQLSIPSSTRSLPFFEARSLLIAAIISQILANRLGAECSDKENRWH